MDLIENIKKAQLTIENAELNLIGSNSSEQGTIILNLVNNFSNLAAAINSQDHVDISLDEFNEKLNMLLRAYEDQDFDLMVSVLQLEVRPLLEYWLDNLTDR